MLIYSTVLLLMKTYNHNILKIIEYKIYNIATQSLIVWKVPVPMQRLNISSD